MNHSKVIKQRRKDLKMTQEELAGSAGFSMFRIGEIERDKDNLTCDEVAAIGRALSLNKVKAWQTIYDEIEAGDGNP